MKTVIYRNNSNPLHDVAINFQYTSNNSKTGNAVQIWIFPYKWIEKGKEAMSEDKASCFDCQHSKGNNKSCYVRKGLSEMGLKSKVNSLHNQFKLGKLDVLDFTEIKNNEVKKVKHQFVRFGAYGEPVLLGKDNVEAITKSARTWTGYTHQWRNPQFNWSKQFFMASVETEILMKKAHEIGFRTFRVTNKDQLPVKGVEINCPASKEAGNRVQCNSCGLCSGMSKIAKSIQIIKH